MGGFLGYNNPRGLCWIVGNASVVVTLCLLISVIDRHSKLKFNVHYRARTSVRRLIADMSDQLRARPGEPLEEEPPLDCHILRGSNSCNSAPNFFMYPSRRQQIQNGFINFMHIPKSGGTTMKECINDVSNLLHIGEPFLLHVDGRVELTQDVLNGDYHILNDTSLFMGDYSFGFCDLIHDKIGDRKCSTFVILREPYDRMVSNYYHCIDINQTVQGIPDCRTHSITEWALRTKSVLWNQLFTNFDCEKSATWTCEVNYNGIKNAYVLSKNTSYVDAIVAGLDKHFSVIGLTEDMGTSLKMLQTTYGLPFFDACKNLDFNVGNYTMSESNLDASKRYMVKATAKRQLSENIVIRELLYPEIQLYNRAKEIFEIQKKQLLGLQR